MPLWRRQLVKQSKRRRARVMLTPLTSLPRFRAVSTSRYGFSKPTCNHLKLLRSDDCLRVVLTRVSSVALCTRTMLSNTGRLPLVKDIKAIEVFLKMRLLIGYDGSE